VARGDVTNVESPRADPALVPALIAMGHQIKETRGENSGLHIIMVGVDGALVGGASLKAADFLGICEAYRTMA
jgi:triosephosphate isomerase